MFHIVDLIHKQTTVTFNVPSGVQLWKFFESSSAKTQFAHVHQFLASLCQKLQLGENISKEKQMTLQGHHCSLITPGFVCVSPSTRVSLLPAWVCAGSNYANDGCRPGEAQCRYERPVTHMLVCIYTHAFFIPPVDLWPAVTQFSQFWKDRFKAELTKSLTMSVIAASPALFYLSRVFKTLKYWIKGKESCQTLYFSCLENCLVDRTLFCV